MSKDKKIVVGIWLIFISLFSKVCGLIKQIVIAWAFGANNTTDVYFIADGAVAMAAVVVSGAFSVTLLSSYSKKLNLTTKEKKAFAGNVMTWGVIASAVVIGALIIFSPVLSKILAPSFSQSQQELLSKYVVMLSFSILLIFSSSLGGAFLEGESDFIPTKLQNVFISIATIALIVALYKKIGIYALLLGYIVGYFFHYVFVAHRMNKKNLFIYSFPRLDSDIKQLMKMSVLIIVGNSAVEINHLIDKMLASGLADGSVSALYYGQIVSTDIVTATLVYSISSIFLRDFSKRASEGDVEGIKNKVKNVCGLYLPIGVLLIVLYYYFSSDLIRLLLMRGSFDQSAAEITGVVVFGYMFCFAIVPIKDVLMKTHYSMLDSKLPMIICIIESLVNVLISYILSKQIGILGIALGTSISSLLSCIVFRFSVTKYFSGFNLFSLKQIIVVALSGFAICGVKRAIDFTGFSNNLIGRGVTAVLLCLLFFGLLILFKYPYIQSFVTKIPIFRGKK